MGKKHHRFSDSFKLKVWGKTDYKCWYCGASDIYLVCEHMDNNGGNEIENIYPSCYICNIKKGTKTLEEFRYFLENPKFTNSQLEYLNFNGIKLPKTSRRIIFYGETL